MKISSRFYYTKTNGKVILYTSEQDNMFRETNFTKEEDYANYSTLQSYNIDEIDFIELEYGTLATTFVNAKSYSVDIENKKLNLVYFTQEELDAQKQAMTDEQTTNSRIAAISNYASQNTTSIDDLENTIIQLELTKIQNGDV